VRDCLGDGGGAGCGAELAEADYLHREGGGIQGMGEVNCRGGGGIAE